MISVLDDMAASIEEFQELLDHEVQQQVDLVKLRDSARHGIPVPLASPGSVSSSHVIA